MDRPRSLPELAAALEMGEQSAKRLLQTFLQVTAQDLRRLELAVGQGEAAQGRELAHHIKGAAAGLGFEELRRSAEQLQAALGAGPAGPQGGVPGGEQRAAPGGETRAAAPGALLASMREELHGIEADFASEPAHPGEAPDRAEGPGHPHPLEPSEP
jgi:HPt (histidine-containing phosphotransfer) domain-containing protein